MGDGETSASRRTAQKQPTDKNPDFYTPPTPTAKAAAAAAAVKNVMKPREGEDGYESHPQRATAMPPQRSSRTRSDPRAGGCRERRSSPPSGRANESPREEWGAKRPAAWRRRAMGQLDRGVGGSFFFGARGGRGRAAVPPPPPQGAPRALVRREGGAAEGCGLRRDRGQERTKSGKRSERGDISGNNIS